MLLSMFEGCSSFQSNSTIKNGNMENPGEFARYIWFVDFAAAAGHVSFMISFFHRMSAP